MNSDDTAREVMGLELPRLTAAIRLYVFLGGLTSVDYHDAITRANAIIFGSDIDQGFRHLIGRLEAEL